MFGENTSNALGTKNGTNKITNNIFQNFKIKPKNFIEMKCGFDFNFILIKGKYYFYLKLSNKKKIIIYF
jgi:hypothetical protein